MIQGSKSLVGRARELAEMERGLDEAMAGAGGLFLLVGEPGIGKTHVADEVGRRAKERGFVGPLGSLLGGWRRARVLAVDTAPTSRTDRHLWNF